MWVRIPNLMEYEALRQVKIKGPWELSSFYKGQQMHQSPPPSRNLHLRSERLCNWLRHTLSQHCCSVPTDNNVITITNKDGDQNYKRKGPSCLNKKDWDNMLVSVSPKLLGMEWIEKWRRTSRIILTPAVSAVSGKTSIWATRVECWPGCLVVGWQEAVENTMCVFVCVWGGWSGWSGAGNSSNSS